MGPEVRMKVRFWLPGTTFEQSKEAFDYFMEKWTTERKKEPFLGEYTLQNPDGKNNARAMNIEFSNVSHVITDIDKDSYDPKTRTVDMKFRFTGPKSPLAIDEHIRGNIRLAPRFVKGIDRETGKQVSRIVTWDIIHRPNNEKIDKMLKDPMVQAELATAKSKIAKLEDEEKKKK